ncbi:MAG TPA: hypothetical protein VL172_20160 [Kofleriaceae bacterium]|nr:hypothetical protein [Kofleriaceae bacterium]
MWYRLRSIVLAPANGESDIEPINPVPIVAIISLVGIALIGTALFF